jgi:hypothetical protein
LGLEVDASGAIVTVRQFSRELDKSAVAADAATRKAKEQDAQLRKLVESGRMHSDTLRKSYENMLRMNGLWDRYLQIQRQVNSEMQHADMIAEQHAAAVEKVSKSASNAGVSIRSLRSPLSTLTAQLAGVNPTVAQFSGLLGSLALGSGVMVGVLAGAGALAFAYDKMTAGAREAKKASDDLIDSLSKQRKATIEASEAGQQLTLTQARNALAGAKEQLRQSNERNKSLSTGLNPAASLFGSFSGGTARESQLEKAKEAVRQAELNLQAVEIEGAKSRWQAANESYELEKSLAADRKRWADEELATGKKISDARKKFLDEYYGELDKNAKYAAEQEQKNFEASVSNGVKILQQIEAEKQARREALGLNNVGSDAVRATKQRGGFDNLVDPKIVARFNQHVGDLGDSAKKAAQTISQAAEYFLVQKLGGGSAAGNFGASIGKGILQDNAGGFAKTALGSALFNPIAAGLGAAVGGVVDKLFDLSGAASAASKAFREAQQAFKQSLKDDTARANGLSDSIQKKIEDEQLRSSQRRQEAVGKFPGQLQHHGDPFFGTPKPGSDLDQAWKQIAANEAAYIANLKEEAKIKNRMYAEDLQVRLLRAQGREREADQLAQ